MLMTYELVQGEGLRTTYAFAPRVTVSTKRDGPTSVRLEFASSPIHGEGQEFRVTCLTFNRVFEYGWAHFESGRPESNGEDVEFALIEIADSEVVSDLRAGWRPNALPRMRHYRICFDDNGTYDVICEHLDISYGASVDNEYYP
jgi:hypothetical protein